MLFLNKVFQIVNQFTTLCDTLRVAEDMGKIQFQLRVLRMPILGWKGSFVVSQVINMFLGFFKRAIIQLSFILRFLTYYFDSWDRNVRCPSIMAATVL